MSQSLRTRSAWLVFVFAFLALNLSVKSQSNLPVQVCRPMLQEWPLMCLTAVDGTPLGNRTPIILIHGWAQKNGPDLPEVGTWTNLLGYTSRIPWVSEKFKYYQVGYFSNLISVRDISGVLALLIDDMDAIDKSFASKHIVIISHSMGGLVARSFMQEWRLQNGRGVVGGERVLRLVTLATPHHGTPVANGPSRDDIAGGFLGWIIDLVDNLFFNNTPWHGHNRYDLHDDGYLNFLTHLDYNRFPQDLNEWLSNLNLANPYWSKLSAYAGSLWPKGDLDSCTDGLRCSALLIDKLYNLNSDGIVPNKSAVAQPCDGCVASDSFFNGYDHYQMARGLGPEDSYFFGAITSNLSDFASVDDNRFGPVVTLGDSVSESFHNLRGWGEAGRDIQGTFRRLNGVNYLDFFVSRINAPYNLSFKRVGSTCGREMFFVYVTINDTDVPTNILSEDELQCRFTQGASLYQFKIPAYAVKKNKVRVAFTDWSPDLNQSIPPIYYVRLDPS